MGGKWSSEGIQVGLLFVQCLCVSLASGVAVSHRLQQNLCHGGWVGNRSVGQKCRAVGRRWGEHLGIIKA